MKCVVCKVTKEKGEGRQRWVFSSEKTPISKVQLIFKLYDLTKREFCSGSVCPVCFDLVAQIDSIECQMLEVTKSLKSRVNCCATQEDYMATHAHDQDFLVEDELEDVEEDEEEVKQRAKKRKKKENLRLKQEKPDYVDYDESNESIEVDNNVDMNHYLSVEHIKKEKEETQSTADLKPSVASNASGEKKTGNMPNKSPENLDFNLTVTRTTRGHDQLVYEGYTYLKTSQQPSQSDITRWKCTSYYASKTGCRAKLHTSMNGMCVLLDSITEHNHPPPDEKQLKIILFREQVKQIANNHPEMKPMEILSNARMLLDTPTSLGLKDESIMRYIQRIKSKYRSERQQQQGQPKLSTNLKSEHVQPQQISEISDEVT